MDVLPKPLQWTRSLCLLALCFLGLTSPVRAEQPHSTEQISVRITRVEALSQDSCGGAMDFSAKMIVKVDGRRTKRHFKRLEGNRIQPPDWGIAAPLGANTRLAFVDLEIRDNDQWFCGGRDDIVDINPDPFQRRLRLAINFRNRAVLRQQGLGWHVIGQLGQPVLLSGTRGQEIGAVELFFRTHTPQQPAVVVKKPTTQPLLSNPS